MNLLQQSALVWNELIEYHYTLTYGYKKQLYVIHLSFSLEEYPHLAGFQYLKDTPLPHYSSTHIVSRILENKIPFDLIKKSNQYETMIEPRLKALAQLKESLDTDFILYAYQPHLYPFHTTIKADYLLSFNDCYIFISTQSHILSAYRYVFCSIFQKSERDYTTNQKPYSLLKKVRTHLPTNSTIVLLDLLSTQI